MLLEHSQMQYNLWLFQLEPFLQMTENAILNVGAVLLKMSTYFNRCNE